MRALFFNVKGAGHVNPTLPLVSGLIARGHEVIYALTAEWKSRLEALGCTYRNSGGEGDGPFSTAEFHRGAPFRSQLLPTAAAIVPHLLEEARRLRPDVIVYDSCAPWGWAVATILGCPAVCSVSTLVFDREEARRDADVPSGEPDAENSAALAALRTRFGVDLGSRELGFFYGEDNLVYSCEELNPSHLSIAGRFHFVGPLLGARDDAGALDLLARHGLARFSRDSESARAGRRRVYVSMGTIVGGGHPLDARFFAQFLAPFVPSVRSAAEAQGTRDDCEVLVSVGATIDPSSFGELPAHVTVRPSVPQLAVLAHADLFVTHAGANSLHEGLWHDVPLVCVPRFGDQPESARRVTAHGAGVTLPLAELSAPRVSAEVSRVLDEPRYGEGAARLGKQLRAAGGLERALDVVERRAARRGSPRDRGD